MLSTDSNCIMIATTFLIDSVPILWVILVQAGETPQTWPEFVELLNLSSFLLTTPEELHISSSNRNNVILFPDI